MSVAVAGTSPPGVRSTTSHLPAAPAADVVDVAAVEAGAAAAGAGAAAAAVAVARLAVQSPSPKPPKSALPAIVAPSSLPVIVITIELPWTLIVNANLRSGPASVPPSNGSSPIGDLRTPDTLSPTCFNETWKVLSPIGVWRVTSQSPLTLGCAYARGAAKVSVARAARTNRLARLILDS